MNVDQVNDRIEALERQLVIDDPAWRRRVRRLERQLEGGSRRRVGALAALANVLMAGARGLAAGLVTYGPTVWYSGTLAPVQPSAGRLSSPAP